MNNKTEDKLISLIITFIHILSLVLVCLLSYTLGSQTGYKKGQLDYARNKIEYTISDGKIIQFLGEEK